jgi:putative SOS response-associated peptidase YedK
MCAFDWWLKKIQDWQDQHDSWLLTHELDLELPDTPQEQLHWPTLPREIIRREGDAHSVAMAHWGLVPPWADDPKVGRLSYNARSETVSEKPTFRKAFREQRCLMLATAYGEWADMTVSKQPIRITIRGGKPFAHAGLWESWNKGATPYLTCTMITTTPNELVADFNSRMPVVLREEDYDLWLDPNSSAEDLKSLFVPYSAEDMRVELAELPPRQTKKKKPEQEQPTLEF